MNSQNLESNNILLNQTNLSDSNQYENNQSDSNLFKKTYTLIQKKKLADRIENLKSKKQFKQIFKIIYESSDNSYTKDSSGVYINFNSLSNDTIKLIEDYLNIIAPKIDNIPLQSKYTPYFSDEYNPKDSGIKLSNHEKNFLKHVNNELETKNNLIESETSLKSSDQNKTKILVKPFSFE